MWYRRLVSWLRSLFGLSRTSASPSTPSRPRTPTLPLTAPLRSPQSPLDGAATPRPPIELQPRREPPSTVPLARLTTNSQPVSGLSSTSDGLSALSAFWGERDAGVPSQPLAPPQPSLSSGPLSAPLSQPLDTNFEQFDEEMPEPELPGPVYPAFGADEAADEDDMTPGSMLYRRLMILRRLVRQGVYNEGFQPDALPEQYQRYGDLDGGDTPFYGE